MADNRPLSLATLELQAQEKGSTRFSKFFEKWKRVLYRTSVGLFAFWLIVSVYMWVNQDSFNMKSWITGVSGVTTAEDEEQKLKRLQMILDGVGFEGWVPEEEMTDLDPFVRYTLTSPDEIDRIEKNGMVVCVQAVGASRTNPVETRGQRVSGYWSDWMHLRPLLYGFDRYEYRARHIGQNGNGPITLYAISLPQCLPAHVEQTKSNSHIPYCSTAGAPLPELGDCDNEVVRAIWSPSNRRKILTE